MSVLQALVISSVAQISGTAKVKLGVVQLWQSIFIVVQCGEETLFWFAVGWSVHRGMVESLLVGVSDI